ncbi:hypothetical protein QQF64_020574 [Cirrhinus molitorella]|uniref:Uncharacterized protein n=1 Tax=Cirrhinus molitorella TaxID=172907 RepID=A0ABR3LCZ6_9TELE
MPFAITGRSSESEATGSFFPEVGGVVAVHRGGRVEKPSTEGCSVPLCGIVSVDLSTGGVNTYVRHLHSTSISGSTNKARKDMRRSDDSGGRERTRPFAAVCSSIL